MWVALVRFLSLLRFNIQTVHMLILGKIYVFTVGVQAIKHFIVDIYPLVLKNCLTLR